MERRVFDKWWLVVCFIFLRPISANAAWSGLTGIDKLQISAEADSIYVYLTANIDHTGCSDPTGSIIGGIILRQSAPNFDQIYSRVLIAEQTAGQFKILDSAGNCVNDFWVENPYIRFE